MSNQKSMESPMIKMMGTCLYGDGNLISKFVKSSTFNEIFDKIPLTALNPVIN